MKNLSVKFFIATLLFVLCPGLLRAQNPTNGSNTNTLTAQVQTSAGAGAAMSQPPGDIPWRNNFPAPPVSKTIVALAAILSPFILAFGLPVVILIIIFYFRHRRNQMVHETVRAMIEKGMPVTPELIAGLNARGFQADIPHKFPYERPRSRHLLPGLILTGIGLALIGVHPRHAGTGGWIVLFIGLAFLIAWVVDRKQNMNVERNINVTKEGVQISVTKQDNAQQPPKI